MKRTWFALVVLVILAATIQPARAGVLVLPANEVLYVNPIDTVNPERSGYWWNPENVFANDAVFAIDTVIQFKYDSLGVGFDDPGSHPTWVITNVSLSARHRGHYWNTRARYIPYVNGDPLINEADTMLVWPPVKFGVTEMTNTIQITQLDTALADSTWDWSDIAGLSMKYEPRAHGVIYFVDHIYATVTYVDTASPDTGHYFEFLTIPEPQLVGHPFPVVIYAKDHLGAVIPGFNDSIGLTDLTGTINPTFAWFQSGTCSLMITISEISPATAITISDGDTNATSNSFAVVNPGLHHFEYLDIASPQLQGTAFPVTIVASDFYGDTIASFAQQTNLSDLTGTIAPIQTSAFVDGIWTGDVTVNSAITWDVLTCDYTSNDTMYAGLSNGFEVQENQGVMGRPGRPAPRTVFAAMVTPNPVRDLATIELALPSQGRVRADVYNILGQSVASRDFGILAAGSRSLRWSMWDSLKPGVYFFSISLNDDHRTVRKVMVVR